MSDIKKVWYAPNKFEAFGKEEIQAVVDCLNDGWLAPGPRTEEFQKQVAARFGKKYGLFVNSGSSANMLAYLIAGVEKGTEVVTPACTFSTTVAPLAQIGAKVIFCDIVGNQYVPTVEQVLKAVTPNTKVISIPNLLGNKIDWKELKSKVNPNIILMEDSCDTITFTNETDISTVSFYASHIITAGGTGGMVMTNSLDQFNRALRFRDWGRAGSNDETIATRFNHGLIGGVQYDWKFIYTELGYNFKACEMNAAFGLAQLKKLPDNEKCRRTLAKRYTEGIEKDEVAKKFYTLPHPNGDVLWLAFPLQCKYRMDVLKYLEDNQVQTRVTMAGNILKHPLYAGLFAEEAAKSFPESDTVMSDGFLVGCHHGMTEADVDRVVKLLVDFAYLKSK